MRRWRILADARRMLFSPVGLRLRDEFSGGRPLGRVTAHLDEKDGASWRRTAIAAVRTAGGVLVYPGLGRRADVVGAVARRYRVRLEADYYLPLYPPGSDGFEFDADPWNDSTPPASLPSQPQDAFLLPSAAYPFPTHVRILHGRVSDAAGTPLPGALVTESTRERVLTDARGAFSLPLRWPAPDALLPIDAQHAAGGLAGSINVQLPDALVSGHVITVT